MLAMTVLPFRVEAQPASGAVASYSEEQVRTFYEAHMRGVVESHFFARKHVLPEIEQLLGTLLDKTYQRYGKKLHIEIVPTHRPESRTIREASGVFDGVPVILLLVPARMDQYYWWRSQRGADSGQMFRHSLTIGIIHELLHLAYGPEYGSTEPVSDEAVSLEEVSTWALTCEQAIRVFVEKGLPLPPEDLLYYEAWVAGGRTELSQSWNNYVKQAYANTR
jgi:hypothetical protein